VQRHSSSDDVQKDIVQSGHACILDEELPPPAMAKSLLAKFKQMEQEQGAGAPPPGASTGGQSRGSPGRLAASSQFGKPAAPVTKQEKVS